MIVDRWSLGFPVDEDDSRRAVKSSSWDAPSTVRFDGLYFTRPLCRGGNNTAQLPWISSSRKKGNKISIKRATKWRRQTFNESTSGWVRRKGTKE